MAAKAAAAILTFLINLVLGVVVFFFMLVAMNGFSESDAEKGLVAYVIVALGVSILMASGAYQLTRLLVKKEFSGAVAALIAVPVFSIVGGGLEVVCSLVGIAIAEYVRVNY